MRHTKEQESMAKKAGKNQATRTASVNDLVLHCIKRLQNSNYKYVHKYFNKI